jgi:hypothetical protein
MKGLDTVSQYSMRVLPPRPPSEDPHRTAKLVGGVVGFVLGSALLDAVASAVLLFGLGAVECLTWTGDHYAGVFAILFIPTMYVQYLAMKSDA